jgi:uncharacterized membrane protein YgcG
VGHATIDYLEGELTWKAHVGDGMSYIEADSAKQRISIEFTQSEVEFFWGEFLNAAEIQKAFGVPTTSARPAMALAGGSKVGALVGGVITLFICVMVGCAGIAGISQVSSASTICVTPTPNRTIQGQATPGPSPTPYCYVPTARPGSGGFFTGGSTRSGSSGRSFGGGHSSGGGGHGGK